VVHWYRQKEGEAVKRILYFAAGRAWFESGVLGKRYIVEIVPGQKRCVLTIKDVIPHDAATYYCACWGSHTLLYRDYFKVFGTGTKLIVSDKVSSPPANSEILQMKHDNQITYVCLIERFYPEVIRVTWIDGENKEITDNVAKGDAWKSTKGDEYSIGSWLTVPAEDKDKNYYCNYEHESGQHPLPTQEATKTAPPEEDCSTYPGNGTVFNRDNLMHRTAYLMYLVLLLKSSMYYLIVLFFIYR
ncbi:IGK protein, partial [Galbula dea]|nr:IGK protein [Galbula dea]